MHSGFSASAVETPQLASSASTLVQGFPMIKRPPDISVCADIRLLSSPNSFPASHCPRNPHASRISQLLHACDWLASYQTPPPHTYHSGGRGQYTETWLGPFSRLCPDALCCTFDVIVARVPVADPTFLCASDERREAWHVCATLAEVREQVLIRATNTTGLGAIRSATLVADRVRGPRLELLYAGIPHQRPLLCALDTTPENID
ncbi:hypothetical protein LIA77_08291 [Sarocladium implicatum]|nr:hypothetical protein LIA77_08291 [Sarocladium implicatum]